MKKFRRINHEDRCQIYALNRQGIRQQSIAEQLGISQSAVSRELSRNRGRRGYTPMGPTVRALPAQGKPFEVFAAEQNECKQYADSQVQGQADRANSTGVLEGIGGAVLGAGLGAALGGGHGAAVGAGVGALGGTAAGASTSGREQRGIQQQYNDAYTQCMVAKDNQVQQPLPPPPRVVYRPAPPPTVVYVQQPPPPPPTVVYTTPPPPPPGAIAYPP